MPLFFNLPALAKATGRRMRTATVLALLVLWAFAAGSLPATAQQASPADSSSGDSTPLDRNDGVAPGLPLGGEPLLRSDPESLNQRGAEGQEDEARPLSREELELLRGLGEEGLDQSATQPRATRRNQEDQALEDLKSLLREIDPRGNLSLDLPVTLEESPPVEAVTSDRASSSTPGESSAGGGNGGFSRPAGSSQEQDVAEGPSGTIGELGDLFIELVSDLRLYAYFALSLGLILSGFGLVALIRWSREKKRRRHGRGRHGRRSHSRTRSRRRRGSRRRLAHP